MSYHVRYCSMLIQCILIVILHFCHPHLLNTHSVQKLKMGTGNNDNCQVSTCRHILVALIHACCTYFTQLQSDVKASSHSEVTLAEVHRLPLGSRSGIPPTSSGHNFLAIPSWQNRDKVVNEWKQCQTLTSSMKYLDSWGQGGHPWLLSTKLWNER